jgi:small subunit ribosomal protein S18
MAKPKSKPRRLKPVKYPCSFCKTKTEPTFTDVESIRKFVSERGKIVGRARTGVCAKHQRKLTLAIKYARHLALLPFVVKPY